MGGKAAKEGPPSRPSSRSRNHSDDLRRASLARQASGGAPPPLASQTLLFGQNLSPETRHKRKVSLSMLKARIDSEVAAAAAGASHPSSRAVSPAPVGTGGGVGVAPGLPTVVEPRAPATLSLSLKHPQFLDESHIFWCHSCRGELVIL